MGIRVRCVGARALVCVSVRARARARYGFLCRSLINPRYPPAADPEVSAHTLRMPVLASGDCAGRFAAALDVMSFNAISLALSQLSSAERCAPSIAFSLIF